MKPLKVIIALGLSVCTTQASLTGFKHGAIDTEHAICETVKAHSKNDVANIMVSLKEEVGVDVPVLIFRYMDLHNFKEIPSVSRFRDWGKDGTFDGVIDPETNQFIHPEVDVPHFSGKLTIDKRKEVFNVPNSGIYCVYTPDINLISTKFVNYYGETPYRFRIFIWGQVLTAIVGAILYHYLKRKNLSGIPQLITNHVLVPFIMVYCFKYIFSISCYQLNKMPLEEMFRINLWIRKVLFQYFDFVINWIVMGYKTIYDINSMPKLKKYYAWIMLLLSVFTLSFAMFQFPQLNQFQTIFTPAFFGLSCLNLLTQIIFYFKTRSQIGRLQDQKIATSMKSKFTKSFYVSVLVPMLIAFLHSVSFVFEDSSFSDISFAANNARLTAENLFHIKTVLNQEKLNLSFVETVLQVIDDPLSIYTLVSLVVYIWHEKKKIKKS